MNSELLKENDMRPEYDFSGGVRGKHCKAYRKGHRVTVHKTDGTTVIQLSEIIIEERDISDIEECRLK